MLPLKGMILLAAVGWGTGRDAGLHLCSRYHHCFAHHPALASALTRVRFIPEGTGVKVLPRFDNPKGAFGHVWGFVCATKVGTFHPFTSNQVIPLFLALPQHFGVDKGVKGLWGV